MSDITIISRPVRVTVKSTPKPIRVNAATAQRVRTESAKTVVTPIDPARDVVIKDPVTTVIDTGGKQGIRGPQGPAGPAGGVTIEKVAAATLGGHRIVRSTGNDLADYADNRNPDHADDIIGLTIGAASIDTIVQIVNGNELQEPSWSWIPQMPIYLAQDGLMTQTPPEPGGDAAFIIEAGFAQSETSMMVRIGTPIYF